MDSSPAAHDAHLRTDTLAHAASSAEHNRKAIKELIDKIPNSKEGILKFQLKWGAYDSGGTEVSGKILVWVKKKVQPHAESSECASRRIRQPPA